MPLRRPAIQPHRQNLCAWIVLALICTAGCAQPPGPAPIGAITARSGGAATCRAPILNSTPTACDQPPTFAAAALYNVAAEADLEFSPFGRPERGWAVYLPQVDAALRTGCGPETVGFAAAVAAFQGESGLSASGALTAETFQRLKAVWQERRPFYRLRMTGVCPLGAVEGLLVALAPQETLGGKAVSLDPGAARALRSMIAAARRDLAGDPEPELLAPFSGYRNPAADADRCRRQGDCQGVVRAECSAHRTGLAVDLNVGEIAGYSADSTADQNRLHQTRSSAYRWLVLNAARFGYVNYVFEPWHWEWVASGP